MQYIYLADYSAAADDAPKQLWGVLKDKQVCHLMQAMFCSCLRPGAHQSSKAAFGKSSFAKTCYNVLSFVKDTTWRTSI